MLIAEFEEDLCFEYRGSAFRVLVTLCVVDRFSKTNIQSITVLVGGEFLARTVS